MGDSINPKDKKRGGIVDLFDFDRDGKLGIVEGAILLSVADDLLSEDDSSFENRKQSNVVDLDDMNIKGI